MPVPGTNEKVTEMRRESFRRALEGPRRFGKSSNNLSRGFCSLWFGGTSLTFCAIGVEGTGGGGACFMF